MAEVKRPRGGSGELFLLGLRCPSGCVGLDSRWARGWKICPLSQISAVALAGGETEFRGRAGLMLAYEGGTWNTGRRRRDGDVEEARLPDWYRRAS